MPDAPDPERPSIPYEPVKIGWGPSPVFFAAAAVIATAVLWFAIALIAAPPDRTPAQRIDAACAREYAGDDSGIQDCRIRLQLERIEGADDAAIGRARRGAGL